MRGQASHAGERGPEATLKAARIGYLDRLRDFYRAPLESVHSWAPEEAEQRCFYIFRCFFALKHFLNHFDMAVREILWGYDPWICYPKALALCIAFILSCSRHLYWAGLLTFLGFLLFVKFIPTFPFTINHVGVEAVVLLIMLLLSSSDFGSLRARKLNLLCTRLIQYLIISVYVYSGIHKVLNGYFLNAEMFGLSVLHGATSLSVPLTGFLMPFVELYGGGRPWVPNCCTSGTLDIEWWYVTWFLVVSWMVLLGELLVPLLTLFRMTRFIGALLFLMLQLGIAITSLEFDFAYSAFAFLLLFLPTWSKFNYFVLLLFMLYIEVYLKSPWIAVIQSYLIGA